MFEKSTFKNIKAWYNLIRCLYYRKRVGFLLISRQLSEEEQEAIYRHVKARKERERRSKLTSEQRKKYNEYMRGYMREYNKKKRVKVNCD